MAWGGSKKAKQDTNEPVARTAEVSGKPMTSRVGLETRIEGALRAREDIAVAGEIEGDVSCEKTVHVIESGRVKGNVTCTAIVITGSVEGNVEAREKITVTETGRLVGDITTPCFDHQPGGFFQGYAHMTPDGPTPTPAAKPTKKKKVRESKHNESEHEGENGA